MAARFLIIFILISAIEIYFLQAVKTFSADFAPGRRTVLIYICYGLAVVNLLFCIVAMFLPPPEWHPMARLIFGALIIFTVCKLFGVSFLLIDDIIRFFRWCFSFLPSGRSPERAGAHQISRLKFLSQLALTFTVLPAIGFIYGMVRGAYKYRVHNVKVPSPNLPPEFDGFRIVQLSDIHTGSFYDNKALTRAFEIVMQQGADMILFTGDLVNNEARELEGFEHLFSKLKAPHGVFSVLGNHDYGDYVPWESKEQKRANLDRLKSLQQQFGWKLLMNEHVPVERNGAKIALLGIENWGGSMQFPKYGRLKDAHAGTGDYPFRILLSHDPSHWERQVSTEYPDIDLTLSGHTHGMQMGIEIPGFRWSPVKYFYKYWAGLYRQGNQFLYVNRGLGFLGYPGRLGIWPEITVLELKKA